MDLLFPKKKITAMLVPEELYLHLCCYAVLSNIHCNTNHSFISFAGDTTVGVEMSSEEHWETAVQ